MSFEYKKIMVVGATSGIGQALAEKMLNEKPESKIIVVGRRKENLDSLAAKYEGRVSVEQFDVTDFKGIEGFAQKTTREHPDLDCIIMNSGIQRKADFSDPASLDLDSIDLEMNTNYLTWIRFFKYYTPFFQAKKEKTAFVFVSSGLGLVPMSRCANYCATKAAVHHLAITVRDQMKAGPGNIQIIEILPPAVQTELHDEKHQADIKNGRQIGMPLDAFTNDAWQGLVEGKDEIPVGSSLKWFDMIEKPRQDAYGQMKASLKEMMKQKD